MQPKFSIEYKSVLVTFEANKHCTTLKSYPSIIVRILSHSYFLSKRIFYLVNKFLLKNDR